MIFIEPFDFDFERKKKRKRKRKTDSQTQPATPPQESSATCNCFPGDEKLFVTKKGVVKKKKEEKGKCENHSAR